MQQVEALLPKPTQLRPLQRLLLLRRATADGDAGTAAASTDLLPALSALLAGVDAASSPSDLLRAWSDMREQLLAAPQRLPAPLQGLFDDLLAVGTDADAVEAAQQQQQQGVGSGGGGDSSAAAAARVEELQARLAAFLTAWELEMAAAGDDGAAADSGAAGDAVRASSWREAGAAAAGGAALRGLVDLVGSEDAARIATGSGRDARAAAGAGDDDRRRGRRGEEGGEGDFQPYELLESVQHDIHIQRYLAVRVGWGMVWGSVVMRVGGFGGLKVG